MSRFTKGPWVADKTSRAVGPVSKEDDQSYGMVLPVAWVEFDPEVEIQAANQQLIAAAPELLEALQVIAEQLTSFRFVANDIGVNDADGFYLAHTDGLAEKAHAAITKALGQ